MSNPLLEKLAKRLTGLRSERQVAKRLSGELQPGSGSLPWRKGDVVLHKFLIEVKSTEYGSLGVKMVWLKKIVQEATEVGKEAALSIQFVDSSGKPIKDGSWMLVPERVFKEYFL